MTDAELIAAAKGWAENCREMELESEDEDRLHYRFRAEVLEGLAGAFGAARARLGFLQAHADMTIDLLPPTDESPRRRVRLLYWPGGKRRIVEAATVDEAIDLAREEAP